MLKDAGEAALSNPAFKPSEGITHCNSAAISIANAFGCHELDGLMADDQYKVMGKNLSGKWKNVVRHDAVIHALDNGLAFAILPSYRIMDGIDPETDKPIYAKHGHLAAVAPIGMQWSGSLQHDVPLVYNVGRTVGLMKTSQAFPVMSGDPYFFIWGSAEELKPYAAPEKAT